MANHKSSVKRARQDKKRRMTTKMKVSRSRTAIKAVKEAVEKGDAALAGKLLVAAQSYIDKLSKSSALSKQAASRKVSRLANKVSALTR